MSGVVALTAGSIGDRGGRCIRGDLDINSWLSIWSGVTGADGVVGAVGSGLIASAGVGAAGSRMPIASVANLMSIASLKVPTCDASGVVQHHQCRVYLTMVPIHTLARLIATAGGSLEARLVWFGARRFETLVSAIEASTWLNLAASTLIIVASYVLCSGGCSNVASGFVLPLCLTS